MERKSLAINLGHGSGGKLTKELLDHIIFKRLKNPYLDQKHDGAIFELKGKTAFSTDSFVINPIFFKGGNIGELAVNGTVNDIAMCGAKPLYLSLSFIIEEGFSIENFKKIVTSIQKAAIESGVQIVTGDTKVVEKGKGDQLFINTSGVGTVHPKAKISSHRIEVGDQIIVSGNIGTHGMAIMSKREGLKFETDLESDTTNLNHITEKLLDEFGEDIHLFRDPTRGGLSSVLYEIADETEKGICIKETELPVLKQVTASCEMLGLDPLYVANEGIFISIVKAEIAEDYLKKMQQMSKGKNARCIGEITDEYAKKVILHSSIGGRRVVSPLIGEQLPRIC
ncbi:MAG: hydrogenase expression/formation protein HypE [Flavobacteriales bacterium]